MDSCNQSKILAHIIPKTIETFPLAKHGLIVFKRCMGICYFLPNVQLGQEPVVKQIPTIQFYYWRLTSFSS